MSHLSSASTRPRDVSLSTHKWCSKGHWERVDEFGQDKQRPDGKSMYCRSCWREINRASYQRKLERWANGQERASQS